MLRSVTTLITVYLQRSETEGWREENGGEGRTRVKGGKNGRREDMRKQEEERMEKRRNWEEKVHVIIFLSSDL